MNSDYNFTMPWAPSVNSCWMHTRHGVKLSPRGRKYRTDALVRMNELGLSSELIGGNVSVSVVLNPPTMRRYDVDNFTKSLFDALTHAGFWLDDEQVQKLTITKGEKIKGGNVEVSVSII